MIIDLSKLQYAFSQKPLVVGGRAMEYYDLRPSGPDIDIVVPGEDVAALIRRFPDRVKDLWGDLGVCPYEFEIWKTICLLDYASLSEGATDLGEVLMISLEKLLLMKALAMHEEKYLTDTKLIAQRILADQYRSHRQCATENERLLQGISHVSYLKRTGPDSGSTA